MFFYSFDLLNDIIYTYKQFKIVKNNCLNFIAVGNSGYLSVTANALNTPPEEYSRKTETQRN